MVFSHETEIILLRDRLFHSPAFGCLIIGLLTIGCLGSISILLDQACHGTLNRRLPIYPGAEVVTERHSFFTAFGVGETYMQLYSADAPDTVQPWYGREVGTYLRDAAINNDPLLRLGSGQWRVRRDDSGEGSEITLYGTCVVGG
ncbi:MAG: hypothetical protein IH587_02780 [Anaerolineae bacterium]|nr:hypothetical protein [Anaerolineae bacterium]